MRSVKQKTMQCFAHSKENEPVEKWQPLDEHLKNVAKMAAEFAKPFKGEEWAYVTGLWHDVGKALPAWQKYLLKQNGIDSSVHCENYCGRPNHSSAGAVFAIDRFKKIGRLIAYIAAGHHAGLPDWYPDDAGGDLQTRLYDPLKNALKTEELAHLQTISGTYPLISASLPRTAPLGCTSKEHAEHCREHLHLWIRILFSCLVDADFLDTEKFMNPENHKKRGAYPSLEQLLVRFDTHMDEKQKTAAQTAINTARSEILACCRAKAELLPGIFSLTVPTGGGKTLSSMAFALDHAIKHGKQRVIMAIPYTSIIEQTARVYRDVFGEASVLEHHSNLDPDTEDHKNRLASENWDAPIVVTTNVQLFESLFASRTSACRKLHNIANSVIILDEAQMLPPEYLKPILSVLRGLVERFGVTVVLCTATQPVLNGTIGSGQAVFDGLPSGIEIIDNPAQYFESLKRVAIAIPDILIPADWQNIADDLTHYEQVLCVVNTRNDCRQLHKLMPDGTIHLSANMCGEERSEIIAEIKEKLVNRESVRVVSTQLVEAGVDIDFPVVYRALCGIDSIAQAAGRCNREGLLNIEGQLGKVVLFVPPKSAPPGLLRKGEDAAKSIISREGTLDLTPDVFKKYFTTFYSAVNDFDKPRFSEHLVKNVSECAFQFRTFAKNFRLIDDTAQRGIIVWYESKERSSLGLIEQLRRNGPESWLLRKLQRFIVNVPVPVFERLKREEYLEDIHGYWAQKTRGLYKPGLGLLPDPADWEAEEFIF